MTQLFNKKEKTGLRKILRNHLTEAEAYLWKRINKKQVDGIRFRRQFSVGNYVLDFYCPEKRIAIEVDDIHHFDTDSISYDKERTVFLYRLGIRVIRYTNIEVMREIDRVIEDILRELRKDNYIKTESNLPRSPLLRKEGESERQR